MSRLLLGLVAAAQLAPPALAIGETLVRQSEEAGPFICESLAATPTHVELRCPPADPAANPFPSIALPSGMRFELREVTE